MPTPQGGGIAVVAAALASVWLGVLARRPGLGATGQLLGAHAAAIVLALVGAVDDIRGLGACAAPADAGRRGRHRDRGAAGGFRVVPQLPWRLERALLLLGGVWFVNLVNFMDGIDWMTVAEVVPVTAGCRAARLDRHGAAAPRCWSRSRCSAR